MQHKVYASAGVFHRWQIENVGLAEIDPRTNLIQILQLAGRQIVDAAHIVSLRQNGTSK
jgi:hypothetical protein